MIDAAAMKSPLTFITEKDSTAKAVEGETDVDLRDAENIPFTYDGGIDSFIQNEVLTYAPDAYVDEKKTQVGYEIELREMKDIIESLNALEKEADGMMAEIMDTPILSIQLVTRQEMLMDIKS